MLLRRLYYRLKPVIPYALRLGFRRWRARRLRERFRDVWPIDEAAGQTPKDWPGWPGDKRFAFVLTHDVESQEGVNKVRALAEIEMQMGFRSCFNFTPEGSCQVSEELRQWLVSNGFEVGIHDLHHDGKLFDSREGFARKALRINHYLKAWSAVGFRSGFMLHNLDWMHDLDVLYDSSTFDTDPFEPQPDGVGTIFPFWVPTPASPHSGPHPSSLIPHPFGKGYVEMPCTLAQDSTLFLIFQETTIEIWQRKLDWIVQKGGMAMLNVHPDYVDQHGDGRRNASFPVGRYTELLTYVRQRYAGQFWPALPREVAQHTRESSVPKPNSPVQTHPATRPKWPKIWIDLDNTPHVPFFKPIIRELKAQGCEVMITARDAFQVCDLADKFGISYQKYGRHHGKHMYAKVWGVVARAVQLAPTVVRNKPTLALNHGSRAQTLLSNFLRIPTVTIMDYEHAGKKKWLRSPRLLESRYAIIPDCVSTAAFSGHGRIVLQYRGIKEDVYAPELSPDPALLLEMGISDSVILATVRPPADEAHYHNPESEIIFKFAMEFLLEHPNVRIVMLPRKKSQEHNIRERYPAWFSSGRVVVPSCAIDGMNLLWFSDLVVSGGGTMNREAAALGVPVYSVFRGPVGAVDRRLVAQGRLVMLANKKSVVEQVIVRKRDRAAPPDSRPRHAMGDILQHLEDIVQAEAGNRRM